MGGHGSASLPGIGPQPRQGARPAPGWGLLGGSGSAPATRTPAATRELRVHPCGHLEAPHVHFQGHQGALRVHLLRSPGTQVCTPTDRLIVPRVHPSETWDCSATPRRDAAQPTPPTPGLCALWERKEQLGGGRQGGPETARPPLPPAVPGQVQRLQQPSAPCLCRRMPPGPPQVSGSAGPWWILGWPGRSRKAPPAKDAGGEGSARRSLWPSDLTMVGRKPPCAFYTSAPYRTDASRVCRAMAATSQGRARTQVCTLGPRCGRSFSRGLAVLLWLALQLACPSLQKKYFRKKGPFP